MMPTFPSSSLKFRTAGFPRYGFKAGMSDKAFPFGVSLTSVGLPLSFENRSVRIMGMPKLSYGVESAPSVKYWVGTAGGFPVVEEDDML
jgi:hypothetical protein